MIIIENNCINDESVSDNVLFFVELPRSLEIKTQISENETRVFESVWTSIPNWYMYALID